MKVLLNDVMPGRLIEDDSDEAIVINELISFGALLSLDSREAINMIGTNDDVVSFFCSDDHTDMGQCLQEKVAGFIHPVRLFGGPLMLSEEYGGFDHSDRRCVIRNIEQGMNHKGVDKLVVNYHFPCGMSDHYHHDIAEVLTWSCDIIPLLEEQPFMDGRKVVPLAHFKRIKRGNFSQRTYMLGISRLTEFFQK